MMVFGGGAFKRLLGYGPSGMRLVPFIRDTGEMIALSPTCEKAAICKRAFTRNPIGWHLTLALPDYRSVRNKCLLLEPSSL